MAVTMARYTACLGSLQDLSSHIRPSLFQDLRYRKMYLFFIPEREAQETGDCISYNNLNNNRLRF